MEALEKVKQNGQQEKTIPQQCMEEIQPILEKYKCQIICVPQKMYGQTIFTPMIEEIKS